MKNLFKISTGISEMPITQQKNISGGFWDNTIGLSTAIIEPDPDWPSFSFPSSTPPTYGSGGGGYDPDPEEKDNINDPHKLLEGAENKITERITNLKELLKTDLVDKEKGQKLLDAYEKALKTIELMKDSDKKYRVDIKEDSDGNPNTTSGDFTYDSKTGEYVLTVDNADDLSLLAHELEHVDQFENGELGFDKNGNLTGYDIQDEVDAYQQQEFFDKGVGYETITDDSVWEDYPGIYDHLKPNNNGDGGGDTGGESLSSFSRS